MSTETFIIPGLSHRAITYGHNNLASKPGYTIWTNACAVANRRTVQAARQFLFNDATTTLDKTIAGMEKRLAELKAARAALGDDTFNLGQFQVRGK